MLANARQHRLHLGHIERAGAGHALERHGIHIATGHARHLRHALGCGGGREQEDQVHVVGAQRGGKCLALLGWVIDHQHAINPRGGGVAHKAAFAPLLVVAFNGVGVTHEDHRRGAVALAEGLHHGQYLGETNAERECAVARFLDHRAVGRRVGKRHTQLDHIGATLDHAVHEAGRDVGKREAGRDEGNERLALLGLEGAEGGVDAAHGLDVPALVTSFTTDGSKPPLTDWPLQLGRQ